MEAQPKSPSKGPAVCVCDIHEDAHYSWRWLMIMAGAQFAFLICLPASIISKNWTYVAVIAIWYALYTLDFVKDLRRYTAQGHTRRCRIRRALLNTLHRWNTLKAPGD